MKSRAFKTITAKTKFRRALKSLGVAWIAATLTACGHKAESPEEAKPVITGDSISFPATSPALANIQTAKVAPPQAYFGVRQIPGEPRGLDDPEVLAAQRDDASNGSRPAQVRAAKTVFEGGDHLAPQHGGRLLPWQSACGAK